VKGRLDDAALDVIFRNAYEGRAGDGDHWLRHALLRAAPEALPAQPRDGRSVQGQGPRRDAEFFPGGRVKSNFLCDVGHGDPAKVLPRLPRLDFDEACTLL
jgi:hypothetical protein